MTLSENAHMQIAHDPWTKYVPFILTLIITQCVAGAGLVTIFAMLTTLYREHPGSEQAIGWVVTSYLLTSAITGAICGRIGDIFGTRIAVLGVLIIASIGSVISAFAPSLGVLIAGATLQGVASSLMPLLVAMTREYLPQRLVPVLIGTISATGTVASGIFFMVTGFITDHYSSHAGFLFKTVLAFLSFVMVLVIVPRRPRLESAINRIDTARIDMVRGVLFGPAIAGLLIILQYGSDWGWTDQRTVLLFVGSILLLAYWSRHQWRAANPLIQLRLMMHGKLLRANLVMLLFGAGCSQIGQILVLTLQQPDLGPGTGFGMSGTMSGLLMIPLTSVALFISPLSGRIAVKHGARRSALIGASLALLAWMLLALYHGDFWVLMSAGLVTLIGISFVLPAAFTLIVEATPREATSGASGLGYTLYQLGYAVGAQIMLMCQRADTISTPDGVSYSSSLGLSLAYGFAAAMTVPLILTVLSISKQRGEKEEPAARGAFQEA